MQCNRLTFMFVLNPDLMGLNADALSLSTREVRETVIFSNYTLQYKF